MTAENGRHRHQTLRMVAAGRGLRLIIAFMATLQDLAARIDRLLLRHEELERTNKLLLEQVASVTNERDSLKSRLTAARSRIDTLLERLPSNENDKP
jgi:cell division protein ZapB